jgi:hypothetical protein
MKLWMLFPFVWMLGWGMGAWLPKVELRQTREALSVAQKALRDRAPRQGGLVGVTQMLGIPESEGESETDNVAAEVDAVDASAVDSEPESLAVSADSDDDVPVAQVEPRPRRSMQSGIEQAMEVWDARSDIARSTFVSNVGLTDDGAAHFDVLLEAMNIRLAHSIEEFAEKVNAGAQIGEEDSIKLMRDLSTSVAFTYDELDASMPENWRESAGADFSATDFIDPAVALPLATVEGDLGEGFFRGGS